MRCPACEYALWNLLPGPCPECGRAFRSDEFEFEPGSVAFLCGACGQEYFGTDSKGLLVPRTFACVACGAACDCGAMAVAPTDRIDPLADRGLLPWIDRGLDSDGRPRRGFFNRFFATVWWMTARGWKAVDGVPREAGTGQAWGFLLAATLLNGLTATLSLAALMAPLLLGGPGGGFAVPAIGGGAVLMLGMLAVGFVGWSLLSVLMAGLLAHGLLLLTGVCHGSLGRTLQAMIYPHAVTVWGAVPCCAPLTSGVLYLWSTVLACGTVKRMQRVSTLRACTAALVPGIVVWLVIPIGAFLAVANVPVAILGPGTPPPPTVSVEPATAPDDADTPEAGGGVGAASGEPTDPTASGPTEPILGEGSTADGDSGR
ncbi:MAG: hypothetical protein ACO3P9_09660 [Phycisphaerales bacterium]